MSAILFNSPALHALRRDQLQKLCKIHALKANGKTSDLVDRLRQHALTLPNDDPLSIAARSEPDTYTPMHDDDDQLDRPSEQWEIVMESIQEVEETTSSQGTLTGSGEFGATARSKSSAAIKAFANSIGLTRTVATDELAQKSIPYDAVRAATPPLNDNFTFDPTHTHISYDFKGDPLPGCTLRPGVRAPDNARLSLGLGPDSDETMPLLAESQATTTLRLVSSSSNDALLLHPGDKPSEVFLTPKLKPFKTTFDLVMSPGGPSASGAVSGFWAPDARPEQVQHMYPKLTIDDLPPVLPPSPIKLGKGTLTTNTLSVPAPLTPDPFIFGSPLPKHSISNSQFKTAATSVLEEMNQRLRLSGVDGVGMDIVEKLKPGAHTQEDNERERRPLPVGERRRVGEMTTKFEKAHQAEFEKMEGIDGVVRRGVPPLVIGKKRKSDVLGEKSRRLGGGRTSGTTRVINNGRRGKALPGVFDDEDEVEERTRKKARMDYDRVKIDDAMNVDHEGKKVQILKEKERDGIKRKLDMSRAKRRSSGGGTTTPKSGARKSIAQKEKGKPSKLGFLASAKKFVTSMWGKKPAAQSGSGGTDPAVRKLNLGKKKSTSGIAPTTKSSATKAPGSIVSGTVVAQSQEQKPPRLRAKSVGRVGNEGSGKVNSVGVSRIARPNGVSSMGMRPRARVNNHHEGEGKGRVRVNLTASSGGSRLLAPTASSLAKVKGLKQQQQPLLLLGTITNCTDVVQEKGSGLVSTGMRVRAKSPSSGLPLWSPRSLNNAGVTNGKIFRKPLAVTGVTGIPVLVSKKGGDEEKMDVDGDGNGDGNGDGDGGEMKASEVVRQRTLTRKPRISRSKVIAKLASQRAATSAVSSSSSSANSRVVSGPSGSGKGSRPEVSGTPVSRGLRSGRRTRSSLGEAKRGRAGIAGGAGGTVLLTPGKGTKGTKGGRGERERSVVVSARKRFRQSEIARRRSRVSCGE